MTGCLKSTLFTFETPALQHPKIFQSLPSPNMGNRNKKSKNSRRSAAGKVKALTSQQSPSPGISSSNTSQLEAYYFPRWIVHKFSHAEG